MTQVTVNSYFAGAGLMDIGLSQAGIIINQAFEIDEDACKTYRHNLGDHIKRIDITQKLVLDDLDCHGMVFTYPCTKYSALADVHSTRTGDELFLHALRHIAVKRPEFYCCENVPGMAKFPIVMEALSKLAGYYIQVFCPISASLWLPQSRDRLIIVATLRPFNIRPPANTRAVTLAEILEADPDFGRMPNSIAKRMNGDFRDKPAIADPAKGDIAACCLAHYRKDRSCNVVVDKRFEHGVRPYTVREFARLQGLPDTFHFPVPNTEAYKQIGNGVAVPVGRWLGQEMDRYMNQQKAVAA